MSTTTSQRFAPAQVTMPAIFFGHGNPMNAIEDNDFSRTWAAIGKALPRPEAIICVSAHWQTRGAQVTAMPRPRTIHDFGGFPPELYTKEYPAPGSPELAMLVRETLTYTSASLDTAWGLDHGTWSVLCRVYPDADIPVIQLSLDRAMPAAEHYAVGRALSPLRRRGILITGSGNVVHNLMTARWDDEAFDWAIEFDATVKQLILARDHQALINYDRLGRAAQLSIPTNEHFLPLLYILGLHEESEPVSFFNETCTMGSLSMRSVQIG